MDESPDSGLSPSMPVSTDLRRGGDRSGRDKGRTVVPGNVRNGSSESPIRDTGPSPTQGPGYPTPQSGDPFP